jgi:RNA polymerase sigma-70 factor, ECF subfamily
MDARWRTGAAGTRAPVSSRAAPVNPGQGLRSDADFTHTLRAAQSGDEWAISCLWRQMHPRLLRFLRGRDARAAEDVASEVWIRVARGIRTFEGNEVEFRAWFFTIARRTMIDWRRHVGRRPVTVSFDQVEDLASRDDAAEQAIAALDSNRALELVARLPTDQADVLLLRVVAGLDVARVSEILGKRPGTVRVLQHRALRRLAQLLGCDGPISEGVTS